MPEEGDEGGEETGDMEGVCEDEGVDVEEKVEGEAGVDILNVEEHQANSRLLRRMHSRYIQFTWKNKYK